MTARDPWLAAAPGVFVLLWSTGFIGAKLGLPYAEPLTFLLLRFVAAAALILPVILLMRASWPGSLREVAHIAVAGLLIHAAYLSGVYVSIAQGTPAGVVALITSLQPLLTAIAAGPLLGEKVDRRQWLGLWLGLIGVALVVADKLTPSGIGSAGFAVFALVSLSAGTVYQKRFCENMDLRSGSFIQFMATMLLLLLLAPLFESMRIEWSGEFIFAFAWLVVVLSLGAVSLLLLMIRKGKAAKVASLFYLVPPVTALIAFAVFDEKLGLVAMVGMLISVIGVALVTLRRQDNATPG